MISKIKKWFSRPMPPVPTPTPPTSLGFSSNVFRSATRAPPHNEKEIIFHCEGRDVDKVCIMLHQHAFWLGQNNIKIEKFITGWRTGGVVRYRFKTTKDALHFKLVWVKEE